jgi:hypothetical protein
MSTTAKVNEPPSPHDRTRGLAENPTGSAIALLIATGLICLVIGMIYLGPLFGPAIAVIALLAGCVVGSMWLALRDVEPPHRPPPSF